MDIPIITTQSYFDEPEEQVTKRKRPRSKYEFKGSQSHRCSLVAVCEADTGKTTVKWSSVRVGREARKSSTCTKTNSANGGLSLTSPSRQEINAQEIKEVGGVHKIGSLLAHEMYDHSNAISRVATDNQV